MSQQDHYAVLGLTDKASDEEIRKAYKRLALRWHPDRDKTEAAKAMFIAIKAAHRVLSNPTLRADYDARRSMAGLQLDESILLSEDENLFASQDSVFRAQSAVSKPQAPPNLDIFDTISITLAELYTGVVRWLEVKRRVRCSDCQPASPGCRTCNGRHLVEVKKKLKLEISAFHEPPAEYRFAGDGDESLDPRVPPGDVVIRPTVLPHALYRRRGVHLIYEKQITPQDLLCGFIFELPPLDRRDWRFSMLDQVVDYRGFYAARGFGMYTGAGSQRGDLLISFSLRMPRRLITEKEDWIASWQELNREDDNYAAALELLSESEYAHVFQLNSQ